ncbi:MAG: cysteine desulfurase family protein [Vicinamibacterales bacterium]
MTRLYLDHNATTPPAPEVAERVARTMRDVWGNASSVHHFGQQAKAALDDARSEVAALVGGEPSEVIFTAGGTESDNFALRGAADALEPTGRRHLIATAIEHEAVLNTLKALARRGWRITLLPVDTTGLVSPLDLEGALTGDTALVSVMHANNEIGTIQPVAALAALAHERGALFHTDAVQSAGKIPLDVRVLGIDLLSLAGHKMYGPKGTGALWVRRGVRLQPFQTGGRQERNRRAGTENVPSLAGLGAAAAHAQQTMAGEAVRLSALRDRLESSILATIAETTRNGAPGPRVPNTTNVSFERIEAESLLIALDLEGIAVSSGSACSSGTLEPSHVLKAMGLPHHRTLSSIRFSLGAANSDADIDRVLSVLPRVVEKLRNLTAVGGRR